MMQFTARVSARDFGFLSDRTVLGFQSQQKAPAGARFIAPDPDYVFVPDFFERLRLWWEWTDTSAPLYISGPSGCGKTSAVLQFLARVHAPVVTLTCRRRMDKYELIGQWGADPVTHGLVWTDGPALTAWRHGCVFVVNEMTCAPAEVWVSANDLLEGDAIVVDRTGEVVPRHPNARVIFTDNRPLGDAAETPQYLGRHAQDLSVADRCWHLAADYPDEATERAMLFRRTARRHAGLAQSRVEAIIREAVRFARATRVASSDPRRAFAAPLSPRSLTRFAELLLCFAASPGVEQPVRTALALAVTDGLSEAGAAAMQHVVQFDFAALEKVLR